MLIERDDAERLYLVVDTKGSLFKDDLCSTEGAKILVLCHQDVVLVRRQRPYFVKVRVTAKSQLSSATNRTPYALGGASRSGKRIISSCAIVSAP